MFIFLHYKTIKYCCNNFDSEMFRPIVLGEGLRKLPKSTNHDKIYLLFLWRQKEKWFLRRNRVAKIDQQRRKPQSKYLPSPAQETLSTFRFENSIVSLFDTKIVSFNSKIDIFLTMIWIYIFFADAIKYRWRYFWFILLMKTWKTRPNKYFCKIAENFDTDMAV
jgi:hypothetical protein